MNLAHIISSPEYDCFYFDIEPNPGELTRLLKENISKDSTKELTSPELNDFPLLLSNCDSTFSEELSEIDLLVSLSFGNKDKIFDLEIFIFKGVQSQSFHILSLDDFSTISFVSDSLLLIDPSEINNFLSFPSGNKDKMMEIGFYGRFIENRNTVPKTKVVEGVEKVIPPTTAEEKAQKRLEVAKLLLEAIEKRFGGNAATKKTQRNLLKQQYENFTAPSSETLDQNFDRLQKLMLLRSLSPEWNTRAVVWRNKPGLETMSMDDLYNNLKVYEPEVKGTSSSNTSTQNMAFVSSNNSGSTNEAVNTAHGVSAVST
ncbi:hypothetical protein Tco_0720724 [Tanacetum coccineum]